MMIPVKVQAKMEHGKPEDALKQFETLIEKERMLFVDTLKEIFLIFKAIVARQLIENGTTRAWLAWGPGMSKRSKRGDYASKSRERPHEFGAYLNSITYKITNAKGKIDLVINTGGKSFTDTGRPKLVNYAKLVDKAFGPYTRNQDARPVWVGNRWVTLKSGPVSPNQPVDTLAAWKEALLTFQRLNPGRSMQLLMREATGRFGKQPKAGY